MNDQPPSEQELLLVLYVIVITGIIALAILEVHCSNTENTKCSTTETPKSATGGVITNTSLEKTQLFRVMRESEQCAGKTMHNLRNPKIDVEGTSMSPAIMPESTLLATKYQKNKAIVEGDIVAVRLSNSTYDYMVHRVFSVYKDGLFLIGDNNQVPDSTLYSYDQIEYVICGAIW